MTIVSPYLCQWLLLVKESNSWFKDIEWVNGKNNKPQPYAVYKRLRFMCIHRLKVKRWKKISKWQQKSRNVYTYIRQIDFKTKKKTVNERQISQHTMIKRPI